MDKLLLELGGDLCFWFGWALSQLSSTCICSGAGFEVGRFRSSHSANREQGCRETNEVKIDGELECE